MQAPSHDFCREVRSNEETDGTRRGVVKFETAFRTLSKTGYFSIFNLRRFKSNFFQIEYFTLEVFRMAMGDVTIKKK